jgi:Fe-S cluster assembly protein SufD
MTTITGINTIADKITEAYISRKKNFFGDAMLREKAMESFSSLGIPNRKSEEYKYVNIEQILKDIVFAEAPGIDSKALETHKILDNAYVVVIANGRFIDQAGTSLPQGLTITNIENCSSDASFRKHYGMYADVASDPFIALNTAMADGGVFIHVAKSVTIEKPVHIIHISSASEKLMLNPRNLIVMEENSSMELVESFVTDGSGVKMFSNALTEIYVAASCNLVHEKIQDEHEQGYLLNTTQVYQEKSSVFATNNFTLSGSFIRNNLNIVLDGEHIESHLNGLYLTNGNQVVDNHTLVDHRKPNCNSNELYKGIIEDKSSATFNGKIFVRKDAQKTNAFQSNKNILLSDDGTINTKPQLEIYADDVKCSHGTSTGKLDEDKIFYLRARGLSEASARKLLMHAFASEVVNGVKNETLRGYIESRITERFE